MQELQLLMQELQLLMLAKRKAGSQEENEIREGDTNSNWLYGRARSCSLGPKDQGP